MDEITTAFTVTAYGSDFAFGSRPSRAAVTVDEDDSLCIYLTRRHLEADGVTHELVEQLSIFFEISETKRWLLLAILTFKDPKAIEDCLNRQNIRAVSSEELEGRGLSCEFSDEISYY